ncbi:hypothetical protein HII31_01650 [Pseudocercospora fuligena]|uniref:Luciferase domain-containing protein n=1 Tax=Pseudocercospora fuligena TaxID=685502 RepID=A0A8H6VSI2_9PEZI|nr:hypothetical protein HII31_01650 [Pseudocercospora fuligena]
MSYTATEERSASPGLLNEYKQWKAMGAGGVSHDWTGFMLCKGVETTIARSDTTNVEIYKSPEINAPGWKEATESQKQAAQKSFSKEPLPEREGPRVRALKFVFPQRERPEDHPQPQDVREAYLAAFDKLIENSGTEWGTSKLEKRGTALFMKESLPLSPLAVPSQGEICHIHGTDLSGHVTLSFPDAKEVIEKGWGERHRLSGTSRLHLGYTMVFVPNNVRETEVLAKILQAGVDYMKSC